MGYHQKFLIIVKKKISIYFVIFKKINYSLIIGECANNYMDMYIDNNNRIDHSELIRAIEINYYDVQKEYLFSR